MPKIKKCIVCGKTIWFWQSTVSNKNDATKNECHDFCAGPIIQTVIQSIKKNTKLLKNPYVDSLIINLKGGENETKGVVS